VAAVTVYEILLGILLVVSVVLTCLAAGVYYGERPEYNARTVPSQHSLEDREAGTIRLTPPHPRNLE
jgi:hypothetical protein